MDKIELLKSRRAALLDCGRDIREKTTRVSSNLTLTVFRTTIFTAKTRKARAS